MSSRGPSRYEMSQDYDGSSAAARLIVCFVVWIMAVVVGVDAYKRYQTTIPAGQEPGVLWDWGEVQAVVPTSGGQMVTSVRPGIEIDDATFERDGLDAMPWFPKADNKYPQHITVSVTLPRPVAKTPELVGIILRGMARNHGPLPGPYPGGSRGVMAASGGLRDGVVVVAPADTQDPAGNATAIVSIVVSSRMGWCKGKQCFIRTPTVLAPLWEPQLAAANGDAQATVNANWWDRILSPALYKDKPKKVSGMQRIDLGAIPLSADLASVLPPAEPTRPGLIQWNSDDEITGFAKFTDNDLESTQQNDLFIAGVEVGIATALAPWGMQLLLEVMLSRRRRTAVEPPQATSPAPHGP
ncbi:hypothetical protein ABGB07_28240 [Micromonosporaceae bacterium B7E4]